MSATKEGRGAWQGDAYKSGFGRECSRYKGGRGGSRWTLLREWGGWYAGVDYHGMEDGGGFKGQEIGLAFGLGVVEPVA